MSERAVFLSRLEFSIMLIAGGIEEIACFPLPGAKEVDERQMIKAVYGLVQEGLLTVEADGIKLSKEMEESIASMKASSGYLLMESGDEGQPQRRLFWKIQQEQGRIFACLPKRRTSFGRGWKRSWKSRQLKPCLKMRRRS